RPASSAAAENVIAISIPKTQELLIATFQTRRKAAEIINFTIHSSRFPSEARRRAVNQKQVMCTQGKRRRILISDIARRHGVYHIEYHGSSALRLSSACGRVYGVRSQAEKPILITSVAVSLQT